MMPFFEVLALEKRIRNHEPVSFREILDALITCRPLDPKYASYEPHAYPIYRHWGACGRPIELEW